MNAAAKLLSFEEAGRLKRLIYALDHINDIALIKRANDFRRTHLNEGTDSYSIKIGVGLNTAGGNTISTGSNHRRQFRIEAYDIAHFSGTNVVGAMAVSVMGKPAPPNTASSRYPRIRMTTPLALTEMLGRRLNHSEWAFPDLIVVDGNQIQMNTAENVLKAGGSSIPIVAVTKDERHKADHIARRCRACRAFQARSSL